MKRSRRHDKLLNIVSRREQQANKKFKNNLRSFSVKVTSNRPKL